jgi:hypothetical protein
MTAVLMLALHMVPNLGIAHVFLNAHVTDHRLCTTHNFEYASGQEKDKG